MTYDSFETSTEGGRPVECYEVTAGSTVFRYTSAQDSQTIGVDTFTPVLGLKRTKQEDGPSKRDRDFRIELPTTNPLAQLFVGTLPGFRIRLKVFRFHRDDLPTPEVVQIFDGFVNSASFINGGYGTRLSAKTILASLGRQVPRRTYQAACNHVLYEPATCRVDDTDPAFRASSLSVLSQTGSVLTVSMGIASTYPDGFMNGGYVESIGTADYRSILDQTGDVLTLRIPFATTPTTVNVFAGCGHDISICKSKFDNVINYGGFAFVPKRNPFQSGIK